MKKLSAMFLLSATILSVSTAGYSRGGRPHPVLTPEQKQCVHDCRTACDQKPTRGEKRKCKKQCRSQCKPAAAPAAAPVAPAA
ncbi:MAG TPA: hypothetical protein DIC42_03365 [Holosporales bacterium]|nr:hypothetical protein [Holosporales bacterium]